MAISFTKYNLSTNNWTLEGTQSTSSSSIGAFKIRAVACDSTGKSILVGEEDDASLIVVKLNRDGTIYWQDSLEVAGLPERCSGFYVFVDSNDNFYVTARLEDGTSGNDWDNAIWKFNSSNELKFRSVIRPDNLSSSPIVNDTAQNIAVDSNGNIYWLIDWISNASYNQPESILIKLDLGGTVQWQKKFSEDEETSNYYTSFRQILVDSSDNVILVGTTEYYLGGTNFFICKINSSGTITWAKEENTSYFGFLPTSSALDSSNNIYISYYSNGYKLSKLNNSGVEQWTKEIDVTGNDNFYKFPQICLDTSNNIYYAYESNITNDTFEIVKINSSGTLIDDINIENTSFNSDISYCRPESIAYNSTDNSIVLVMDQGDNDAYVERNGNWNSAVFKLEADLSDTGTHTILTIASGSNTVSDVNFATQDATNDVITTTETITRTIYPITGSANIQSIASLTAQGSYVQKSSANISAQTVIGNDVTGVEDYVETPDALYVDAGYYDAGYAENDAYVQEGYVGTTTIASSVTVSDTVNYTSDSAVVALGGNSISAELDVSGQGAITIDAKATLASEVDLTVQSTMSASAGLVFSQTTNIAADTVQTQTVGLVFSQSTDLAADFASTQLGGNLISASATPASDAQLSSDSDVLQGGILDATATTELNAVAGFVVDGASSVAADVQFTGIAESIPFIDETLESDFALSATGANDVSAELDVSGQGAITITAKATTGSDVELAGQFQFTAIAEVDNVAQATISTQSQLVSLGGLLFEVDLSVASDFESTQTAAITTNNDVDLVSNSNFAIDTTVLIGGISNLASDFVVLDIEPSLFVGGITNIFQGTSTVVTEGSYLYDVPLIRRLVVAPDSRLASISPESRILGVKSESRINTIITETRGLKVPQDNRTHKIYDGSL